MRTLPVSFRQLSSATSRWIKFVIAGGYLLAVSSEAAPVIAFHVPAGDAAETLRIFSRQAGIQIVYPSREVRGLRTNPVHGERAPREALEIMLTGTDLLIVADATTGALALKRGAERTELIPVALAEERGRSRSAARDVDAESGAAETADTIVFTLSPFEVRTEEDLGYKAANSISATRMARAVSELPMTISTFTEDFISDQKAYDLYDVVKWTPGVHQDNLSPQGWTRYNIRGFTSAAVQRNGFRSFRFVDTTNIARVEVVKGPASLLYGQINPGGVINYITKRPENRPAVALTGSIGTDGYRRLAVDATGPIRGTGGKVLYRAIGMVEAIQEFKELSTGRKYLFAPSAKWNLSDDVSLLIEYEHFERRDHLPTSGVPLIFVGGVGTVPYPGLPWKFSYAGEGDYQDFTSDAIMAELNARLGEHVDVRAIYLDSSWDMEWRATGQGAIGLIPQSFIDYYYPPSARLTPADAMYRRNRWEHQWGGERSGQVDVTGVFNLGGVTIRPLAGIKRNFATRQHNVQKNNPNIAGHPHYLEPWDLRDPATWNRAVPFGLEALNLAADNENSNTSTSAYGVLSLAAMENRLQLLGGFARHELRNNPARNFVTNRVTAATERSANVPQVGGLFRVTREVSAFASYSESFLANNSMLRVNNVPTAPASPSVGKGWEGGVKIELLEGRVSGTLSAYTLTASPTGIIVVTTGVDSSGTTLFSDIQGGEQKSEGIEAELLITPLDGLQVMVGYGACDAVYARHPTNPAFNGTRLVATPDQVFNLWWKYTGHRERTYRFTLGGGLNYVGATPYVGNNPSVRHPGYTTIDLTFGYAFQVAGHEWSADVLVKNVTDERYFPAASTWGFPRHAILSMSTRF